MAPAAASQSDGHGAHRRARLADAKLLLIFTPDLAQSDPLAALEAALPHVDIVQVRPKPLGDRRADAPPTATITEARSAYEWCLRVLALRDSAALEHPPLIFVNDRVDVARALTHPDRPRDVGSLDGVHLGTGDMPPAAARSVLGEDVLIGLSSHTTMDVANAWDEPIDMLGFGPVFSTATKGYGVAQPSPANMLINPSRVKTSTPIVVGPDLAWIATETSPVPVFPIGGIDLSTILELERVGRAAVGSAILGADDPARAAQALRASLL